MATGVLNSVAKEAGLGDGDVEKADFVGFLHLNEVQPEPFLDLQCEHRLTKGPHGDFCRPEGEVCLRTQFLHQPRFRTTLVQLFYCFGLMYLQEGQSMQGRGSLSSVTVSLCSKHSRELTGLGWEALDV